MMFSLMISIDGAEVYVLHGYQSVKIETEHSSKSFWLANSSKSGEKVKAKYTRLNDRLIRLSHPGHYEWNNTLLPWGTSHYLRLYHRFPADVYILHPQTPKSRE